MDFNQRILPAPRGGGFTMENYWVWCGSVIKDENELYHMFATIWPKHFPFHPNWLTNARIVSATSPTPEGPYEYSGEVLEPRGALFWDGLMTHNPTIHKSGDTYLLYYTGATFGFDVPCECEPNITDEQRQEVRGNQRIGLAISKSINGPWQRFDTPVLDVRSNCWDSWMTTNPAPLVLPDKSILMLYKATNHAQGAVQYGVAKASAFDKEFKRLEDVPIFDYEFSYEDVCIWYEAEEYRMLFNDMSGNITGEVRAGAYATSSDGINWTVAGNPKGYSRKVIWNDGITSVQGSFERPQILMQDGAATHLFAATSDGKSSFFDAKNTWNMVCPLK